jgi:hypothetical protein
MALGTAPAFNTKLKAAASAASVPRQDCLDRIMVHSFAERMPHETLNG